jgi:hypothetical protein
MTIDESINFYKLYFIDAYYCNITYEKKNC